MLSEQLLIWSRIQDLSVPGHCRVFCLSCDQEQVESKALGTRRTGSRAWCLALQLGYLKIASAETPLHPRCSGYSVSSEGSSNLSSITPGVVISGTILLLKTAEEVRILCFSSLLGLVGRSHWCCCCFGFLAGEELGPREGRCLAGGHTVGGLRGQDVTARLWTRTHTASSSSTRKGLGLSSWRHVPQHITARTAWDPPCCMAPLPVGGFSPSLGPIYP